MLHHVCSTDSLIRPSERGMELLQNLPKQGSKGFGYVLRDYLVYVRGVIGWFQVYSIDVESWLGLQRESSDPLTKRYRGIMFAEQITAYYSRPLNIWRQ